MTEPEKTLLRQAEKEFNEQIKNAAQYWKDSVTEVKPSGVTVYYTRFWLRAMERVRALLPEIERISGRPCRIDDSVQEANFLTDLYVGYYGPYHFRFSRSLFTLTIWWEGDYPEIPAIIAYIESNGYHYIPEATLWEPYNGDNPGYLDRTWWARLFDFNWA